MSLSPKKLAPIIKNAFPINGLSKETFDNLNLYIPDPDFCYSDTIGVNKTAKDGNVALWLNRKQPNTQMVVGSLTSDVGWSIVQPTNGSVTFSSNGVRINSIDGSVAYIQASLQTFNAVKTLILGNTYRLRFTAVIVSGIIQITDSAANVYANISTSGNFEVLFTATATTTFMIKRSGICDGTISNLSIRDLGVALVQTTAGNQPKLRKGDKNLISYSEDLSVGSWAKVNSTATANAVTLSNGIKLSKLKEDTNNTTHGAEFTVSFSGNVPTILQFYCKAGERNWLRVESVATSGSGSRVIMDLTNGTITKQTIGTPAGSDFAFSMTAVETGVYLVTMQCFPNTTTDTTRKVLVILMTDSSTTTYTGDGNSGVYVGGFNLYTGTTQKPYLYTNGSQVSNGLGNWWLDFDGIKTRMNFYKHSSSNNSSFYYSFGVQSFSNIVAQSVISEGLSSNGTPYKFLGFNLDGRSRALIQDTNSNVGQLYGVSSDAFINFVSSLKSDGTTLSITKNNTAVGNTSLSSLTAVTFDQACVGAGFRSTNYSNFFNGQIYGLCEVNNVLVSTTEALAIDRYLGRLVGVEI